MLHETKAPWYVDLLNLNLEQYDLARVALETSRRLGPTDPREGQKIVHQVAHPVG